MSIHVICLWAINFHKLRFIRFTIDCGGEDFGLKLDNRIFMVSIISIAQEWQIVWNMTITLAKPIFSSISIIWIFRLWKTTKPTSCVSVLHKICLKNFWMRWEFIAIYKFGTSTGMSYSEYFNDSNSEQFLL